MSLGAGHVWRTVPTTGERRGHIECIHCGRLKLFLSPADKRWQRYFARINRFAKNRMQPDHRSTARWLFGHGPIGTCAGRWGAKKATEGQLAAKMHPIMRDAEGVLRFIAPVDAVGREAAKSTIHQEGNHDCSCLPIWAATAA